MHISSGCMRIQMATGSLLGTCAAPSGQKLGNLQEDNYNAVSSACWRLSQESGPTAVSSSVQDEDGTPLCTLPAMPPCPSSLSPPALSHTRTTSTPEPQRYGGSSITGQRCCTGLHASMEAAPAPLLGVTPPVTAPAHLDSRTTQTAASHPASHSCVPGPSIQSHPCSSARAQRHPCRPATPASEWPGLATLRSSTSPMLLALTLVLASSCALGSAAAASAASRDSAASRSRALSSSGSSAFPLSRDPDTHTTLQAATTKAAGGGSGSGGARDAHAATQRWALGNADGGGDGGDGDDALLREEVQTLRKRLDEVLDAIEKRNSERRSLAAKGKRAKSPKPSKPPKATKPPKAGKKKNQPPPPPPAAPPSPAPRPPAPRPPAPRPPSPPPPKKSPPPPDIVNRDDSSPPPPPALASERSPPPPVRRPPPPRAGSVEIPPAPPQEPTWPPLFPSPPPSPPMRRPPMEVLRAVGEYRQVGISNVVAVHMVHVPGTDKYLFMERPSGYHPFDKNYIAGYYDLAANRWENVYSPDGLFCCGHTLLASGDVVIVGGHQANAGYPDGMKSVRIFDKSTTRLELVKVNEMGWRRWYPSATLLPDGRVLIMGGTQGVGAGTANNPFWELYNPDDNSVTPFAMRTGYLDGAKQVYYPFNYVLPSGLLFTFCGRGGWIVNWQRNEWRQNVPRLRGYANTQFPFTGTSVMLGLYPERGYEVEVMLFGGQNEQATKDITMIASKNAQRLRMAFNASTGNYTFFGDDYDTWVEEPMSRGRVMPDATLLPNGKVVLLNGANTGLAGDSSGGGESRADYPVLYAEIYDPDAPQGQRLTRMASTPIARMYHSVAALTTDGTVVVAGCDRCFKFKVEDGVPFSPSPTSKAEYRIEVFSPPYFFVDELKPQIISTQADVMDYGAAFRINYWFPGAYDEASTAPSNGRRGNNGDGAMRLTRAVLVAPSSCTHSYNTHQRLVGLETVSDDAAGGVLVVRGPPSINHAPPGMYMLFLLNGEVYGKAAWVRLPRM